MDTIYIQERIHNSTRIQNSVQSLCIELNVWIYSLGRICYLNPSIRSPGNQRSTVANYKFTASSDKNSTFSIERSKP